MEQGIGRNVIACWLCVASGLVAGCDATPRSGVSERSGAVVQDEITHQTFGRKAHGFEFLSPLVRGPADYGAFLPNVPITVRVDELNQDGTTLRSVATFTGQSGPGRERLRTHFQNGATDSDDNDGDADPRGYYYARWFTNDAHLSPAALYRVRVLVPAKGGKTRELGHADLDVVATTGEFRTVDRKDFIPLLNGTSLRIKFRVDWAAVDHDHDGVYDWIDNCPTTANPGQIDSLGNGVGDACRCARVRCPRQDACHLPGTCQPETGACSNPVVKEGRVCQLANAKASCSDGVCTLNACNPRYADCNANPSDGCETRLTSPENCGSCGVVCPAAVNATALCQSGQCHLDCAKGFADCDGNLETGCEQSVVNDRSNCGACGRACADREDCVAGVCTTAICETGRADCNGIASDGCEVNLTSDVNHCGGCAATCALANATPACSGGSCVISHCDTGYADCNGRAADGCEVELSNDQNNCGACQSACALANASSACVDGACVLVSCQVGFSDCDGNANNGCEAALVSDVGNCGACGNACAVPNGVPICASGVCAIQSCSPGYADCNAVVADGCETALQSNSEHCGACGAACPVAANATPICSNAACGLSCNSGFVDCDGKPANGCETDLQGSCGTCTCSLPHANAECIEGKCGFSVCESGFADCDGDSANGCETNLSTNCGECQPDCDDGNPCTVDGCVGGPTCLHTDMGYAMCGPPVPEPPFTCVQSRKCYALDATTPACQETHYPDGTACRTEPQQVVDPCLTAGTCQAGSCIGAGAPIVCSGPPRECYSGPTCNSITGACEYTVLPPGSACGLSIPCTIPGWCSMGYCRIGGPTLCNNVPDKCHGPTQQCVTDPDNTINEPCYGYPPYPDGTSCDNGDPCDGVDTCQAGLCEPGIPLPDGSNCGNLDPCAGEEKCQAGVCQRGIPLPAGSECGGHYTCDGMMCSCTFACPWYF